MIARDCVMFYAEGRRQPALTLRPSASNRWAEAGSSPHRTLSPTRYARPPGLHGAQDAPVRQRQVVESLAALALDERNAALDGHGEIGLQSLGTKAEGDNLAGADGGLEAFGKLEAQPLGHETPVPNVPLVERDRRIADESGDECRPRTVIHVFRRPHLFEAARVHERDSVAHAHGLDLVVGDQDRGRTGLVLNAANFCAHLEPETGIEIRQWLVHQEHVGLAHERASQRHALLLTAGEGRRSAFEEFFDAQDARHLAHHGLQPRTPLLADAQGERDVLEDAEVRIERVGLEDDADVALLGRQRRHVASAEADGALRHLVDAGDRQERCRLAAARGAQERHHLAVAHAKFEVDDGVDAVEAFGELLEGDLHQPLVPPP